MAEVTETSLPGVGVRHDFVTAAGERLGVLIHRSGRRELLVYDREDPDSCSTIVQLDPDDTRTLGELLGVSQVAEAVSSLQQVEGLAIDWLTVGVRSQAVGVPLRDSELRRRTGVTIVAVIRDGATVPSPGPDFALAAGDLAVTVGSPEGTAELSRLLAG